MVKYICALVMSVGEQAILLGRTGVNVQWNPSCEATPFAIEMWLFKSTGTGQLQMPCELTNPVNQASMLAYICN